MFVRLRPVGLRYAILALVILALIFLSISKRSSLERGYDILEEWPSPTHYGRPPQARLQKDCSPFASSVKGEVTIVLKIGAGEVTTRLPSYLDRLGRCKPDILIFSDHEDHYDGFDIIDVLANLRPEYKWNNPDFDIYKQIQNTNTTTAKSKEGWQLDKYKFLPMMEWAYHLRPEPQWFVFVELDTYVNYDNLYRFLTYFDPSRAYYFGSPVWPKGKTIFAHGGTGFVLSRAALNQMMAFGRAFGGNQQFPGSHFFGQDIKEFCCGDEVLARVLTQSGVTLQGYWPMFNGEKPSTLPFNKEQWCEAVITMHHLGDDDFNALTEWEKSRSDPNQPLTFEELFTMVEPHLVGEAADWTNMSEDVVFKKGRSQVKTFEYCYRACLYDKKCMQFEHSGTECRLGYSIRLGHHQPPKGERKWKSGWVKARIEAFKQARSPCHGAHIVHSNP